MISLQRLDKGIKLQEDRWQKISVLLYDCLNSIHERSLIEGGELNMPSLKMVEVGVMREIVSKK